MAVTSRPNIKSVMITPNPVNAKASIKVVIDVEDKEIVFQKVAEYTKEIYLGQQIGVI